MRVNLQYVYGLTIEKIWKSVSRCEPVHEYVQGADDKLGQFLSQDI